MKNSIIKSAITCLLLLSPSTFAATDIIGGEMEFKGVVVAHGCTIVAGDENKVIDFKQISAKESLFTTKKQPRCF
ncbi:fimbrial protein [Proteus mirabilis]|uniref:fimbrial protein n=1 Tax=Proteus mirabilis TaxID=584 RepID=UPI0034DCFF0D